jgi:hypothetical protein
MGMDAAAAVTMAMGMDAAAAEYAMAKRAMLSGFWIRGSD